MLMDLFAPGNLPTTLLCIAALVAAGVGQYLLCLHAGHKWLRQLPIWVCSGACALFLIRFLFSLSRNAWHALSWLLYALLAVLFLIVCGIGRMAAHFKGSGKH